MYLLIFLLVWTMSAPKDFPRGQIITIEEGMNVSQISRFLEDSKVIRSPFWFRVFAIVFGGERRMKAGDYYFDKPIAAPLVAWRVEAGDHEIETVKVTIPEGFTVSDISDRFDKRFVFFDNGYFEEHAAEGYMFPDTYFVPVSASATSVIKFMKENFDVMVKPLMPAIIEKKKTLPEIVTMASLVESEAKEPKDMSIIAGILWKRLKIGMPLQVDSERGTYEFKGLPASPINNPGYAALYATVNSTSSPYLYYLTGKDGKMHYARTFDEHKANIAKYLTR